MVKQKLIGNGTGSYLVIFSGPFNNNNDSNNNIIKRIINAVMKSGISDDKTSTVLTAAGT